MKYWIIIMNFEESIPELYMFLKNKDEIFTDKIPVISIILRPAMRTLMVLKPSMI